MKASGAVRLALLCLALLGGSLYQLAVRPSAPSEPQGRGRSVATRVGTDQAGPRSTQPPTTSPGTDRTTPSRDADSARYDLEADERLGGHTIERHVGKTDEELAARLRRERQISASSTYTDLDTARRVVGSALASSRDRVAQWESREGPRPNLVLRYTAPRGSPVGRSLDRGDRAATPAQRALVVLRWHDRRKRWYVLTSYPEADR